MTDRPEGAALMLRLPERKDPSAERLFRRRDMNFLKRTNTI